MTPTTTYPEPGDRVTVERVEGYLLVQERPIGCRPVCECGRCNGEGASYPGTVGEVVHYGDNSVEALVECDDGVQRLMQLAPPSGDRSF